MLAYERDAKRRRVLAAEGEWVRDMEAKARMGDGADAAGGAGGGGGGGPLGLRGLIDTVIANLELRISNIHIRYEDGSSWPGREFAIGVVLTEISAHTVDEDGRRAFATNEALRTLRKGVRLSKLCVYFDCDAPRLAPPGGDWARLDVDGWDALLLPASHTGGAAPAGPHPHAQLAMSMTSLLGGGSASVTASGATGAAGGSGGDDTASTAESAAPGGSGRGATAAAAAAAAGREGTPPPALPLPAGAPPQSQPQPPPPPRHQFLLCPVDGTMRYTRRTPAARLLESDAAQEVELKLHAVSARLHRLQYVAGQKLLEEFDRYAAGAPHRYLRPPCRPSNGEQRGSGMERERERRRIARAA